MTERASAFATARATARAMRLFLLLQAAEEAALAQAVVCRAMHSRGDRGHGPYEPEPDGSSARPDACSRRALTLVALFAACSRCCCCCCCCVECPGCAVLSSTSLSSGVCQSPAQTASFTPPRCTSNWASGFSNPGRANRRPLPARHTRKGWAAYIIQMSYCVHAPHTMRAESICAAHSVSLLAWPWPLETHISTLRLLLGQSSQAGSHPLFAASS